MHQLEKEREAKAFECEECGNKAELNRTSNRYLRYEELVELRTLELIEDRDIVTKSLPMGQRRLNNVAVLERTTQSH
jgi:hypothetical protein